MITLKAFKLSINKLKTLIIPWRLKDQKKYAMGGGEIAYSKSVGNSLIDTHF